MESITKEFGDRNEKLFKQIQPTAKAIEELNDSNGLVEASGLMKKMEKLPDL